MIVSNLNFEVIEGLFIKKPSSSEIGRKIVFEGLNLMSEIGLEDFTFKKLAKEIGSTESTIYRYFENKNQFLFYLYNYYWSWMEYQLTLATTNIDCPEEQIRRVIKTLTKTIENDLATPFIDESKLQQVIILESSKTFLRKQVDEENKSGYFAKYKELVESLSKIILQIKPDYKYSHSLITTIIESSFHQRFFATHLPRLSDNLGSDKELEEFNLQLIFGVLKN